MNVFLILTGVFTAFGLLVFGVRWLADPPEDAPAVPEIHHEEERPAPPRPPFPMPEPQLDYPLDVPFPWWENDDFVERATGVK